jgi:hypothetical protein
MGYTHHFVCRPGTVQYADAWPTMIDDTRRILQAVGQLGITVCGPDGTGTPVVDPKLGIMVNGDHAAGQAVDPLRIPAPGPVADAAPEDCRMWRFTKTEYLAYDLPVATILLRCQLLAPDAFAVSGNRDTWDEAWTQPPGANARDLIHDLFGVFVADCPLDDPTIGMAIGPGGWIDPRLIDNPVIPL